LYARALDGDGGAGGGWPGVAAAALILFRHRRFTFPRL
jgi:hypothetical protein